MWYVTVADFGIPRLLSEWSYGILMTPVARPDDLYLTGQYVKNQNYEAEHFLILFLIHRFFSCFCLIKCNV